MALICSRIPVRVLEVALKCPFFWADRLIEAGRMLHVFAKNRGMISGSGMPNYAEAAKFVLKKYVSGELLFAALPVKDVAEAYPESVKVDAADAGVPVQQGAPGLPADHT